MKKRRRKGGEKRRKKRRERELGLFVKYLLSAKDEYKWFSCINLLNSHNNTMSELLL